MDLKSKTSAPTGAWELLYKEIITKRPTNRRTCGVIGKLHQLF